MIKISYTIRVPRASIEKEAFCIKTPDERAKMLQNILIFGLEVQEKFSLAPEKVLFLKERSTGNIQIWVD
ncbi:MAG: hypothetical protein H0X62_03485 [Bacteroidetes bacterium]|nr:hypothetical protein [Bacteroidota bacterium]